MNDHDPTDRDHWEMFADSVDLTIEGHRLIAQEIGYEVTLMWRVAASWVRDIASLATRRSTPPV